MSEWNKWPEVPRSVKPPNQRRSPGAQKGAGHAQAIGRRRGGIPRSLIFLTNPGEPAKNCSKGEMDPGNFCCSRDTLRIGPTVCMVRGNQRTHLGPCGRKMKDRTARCIRIDRHEDLPVVPTPLSRVGVPPQILAQLIAPPPDGITAIGVFGCGKSFSLNTIRNSRIFQCDFTSAFEYLTAPFYLLSNSDWKTPCSPDGSPFHSPVSR